MLQMMFSSSIGLLDANIDRLSLYAINPRLKCQYRSILTESLQWFDTVVFLINNLLISKTDGKCFTPLKHDQVYTFGF